MPTDRQETTNYLTVTELKRRGWTDALIRHHLGEPDTTRPNPYYVSRAAMRLFQTERVAAVEKSAQWDRLQERSRARREAAAHAATTKRQALMARLDAVELSVPVMPFDAVTRMACQHYNQHQEVKLMERGLYDWQKADAASDPAFLVRISVNFLRHHLSQYEAELESVAGRVGVRDAFAEINRKVYAAIAATYPALSDECSRQLAAKLDRLAMVSSVKRD